MYTLPDNWEGAARPLPHGEATDEVRGMATLRIKYHKDRMHLRHSIDISKGCVLLKHHTLYYN